LQAVRIAPFGTDGKFTTLDGQARTMQPDDLMIWNEKEPVALAGIMGGLNSEVSEDTTTLLLESANFKGARIRRTATRLGLQTDASQRFEKQPPPATTKIGIERFVSLLQEAGVSPEVRSRFTYSGDLKEEIRRLSISKDFFDRRIGNPIASDKIVSILTSIGFEAEMSDDKLQVGIPPFRSEKDIALPVDILEEVTRINGYDNLEPQLPGFSADTVAFADSLRTEHKARRLLAQAYDFSEIHNYSWFDETWLQTIGYDPEAALRVANPSAEQNVRLRTSLLPNILAVVKRNALHSDRFRIFELGPGYVSVGEKDRQEILFLSGASFQQDKIAPLEEHFRTVKGAIEALAGQLNVGELSFTPGVQNATPWQTAGSYVQISQGTKPVGSLGFLMGPLLTEMAAKSQVVWFELDFNTLDGPLFPDVKHLAGSRYPGSWFDFSIVAPIEASFAQLVSTLDTFSHPFLKKREFVTLYTGKGLDPGMGSYTFRYWIESKDSTLTGEQIEAFQQEYITFLTSKGLKLR
jgi:phenylalanyl-tRNA synthetase beta chain